MNTRLRAKKRKLEEREPDAARPVAERLSKQARVAASNYTTKLVPAQEAAAATLTGVGAYYERLHVDLDKRPAGHMFGRNCTDIDVNLRPYTSSNTVSRHQFHIVYDAHVDAFVLRNNGRNGTRVNGVLVGAGGRADSVILAHGNVITAGHFELTFSSHL